MSEAPLLEVCSLVKTYRSPGVGPFARKNARPALAGVSFSVQQGRSFGIVGESGSGKSTLARIALALDRPDSGMVRLQGRSLFDLSRRELREARAHMQMIFQDPYGSLDPRQRVEKIVAEPLAALGGATGAERRARVRASLEAVGLKASDAQKHPHEFSGGQRQRIAIARALITRPRLVIADEPVSALDVSVQAQTLNLMSDLEREAGVTFLLISHDLGVVAHICETTAVMYRGRIVELGETAALFANPAHPYTRELVDATPRLDRLTHVQPSTRLKRDAFGSAPVAALHSPSSDGRSSERPLERGDAVNDCVYKSDSTPSHHALNGAPERLEGCPYVARCAFARPRCQEEAPALETKGGGSRKVACHFPLD
jgi:peptide/nickel transport system ATP-binding protein